MCRPTQMPAIAETNWLSENAPVTATLDQPVSLVMDEDSAANA